MKLKELGFDIFFDEFPRSYNLKQVVVLTNLAFVEHSVIPKQLAQIYTTQALASHLNLYFRIVGLTQLKDENFVIIEPNKKFKLNPDHGRSVEIMALEVETASRNLLLFIQIDGKITNLYGGLCTDMRSALLQDAFFDWTARKINVLYLNLQWAKLTDAEVLNINNVVEKIEDISLQEKKKIQLIVPLLGYECLIEKLVDSLPDHVAISGRLKELYSSKNSLEYIVSDESKAKIVIQSNEPTLEAITFSYKLFGTVTVKLVADPVCDKNLEEYCGYYKLHWAPFPMPFDMQLLAMLVRPSQIEGIINRHMFENKVPPYLKSLCHIVAPVSALRRDSATPKKKHATSPQHLTPGEQLSPPLPKSQQKVASIYLSSSEELI